MRARNANSSACGLTLVEVATALAIAGLLLTILTGTLGRTVQFAADGFDRFAMARISQTLSDEYRMLDWYQLETEIDDERVIYFDERGRRLDSKTIDAVYAARMSLLPGPVLPGESMNSSFLSRLQIEVSSKGQAEEPFANQNSVNQFSTLYTLMGTIEEGSEE
jgi:uncharacterized protein (TIGR02598 family)